MSVGAGGKVALSQTNSLSVRCARLAIHVPTLVVHGPGDRAWKSPAEDQLAWIDRDAFVDRLELLEDGPGAGAGNQVEVESERVLTTVLFTDIVDATARAAELGDCAWRDLLARHHAVVRRELERFRGREIDTAGDGFFARFDGPAQAIRCACAISDAVRTLGLEVRAGLHTGECELVGDKVQGIAVHIGARVAAAAAAGEVLVSSVVKDLVGGSGLEFDDRGSRELRGVPGEWRLYGVRRSLGTVPPETKE